MSILDITESYAVMPRKLPIKKMGKEYKKVAGYVKLNELSRLAELFLNNNQEDKLLINFEFTDLGFSRIVVETDVNHRVMLKCQRCMQDLDYQLLVDVKTVLVKEQKEISGKYSCYEQVTLENNELVDLYQLLEDEILLSLPIVMKHDDSYHECRKFSDFSI